MVLLNTKGSSTFGKVIPLKLDFGASDEVITRIPWNMSKQIRVGKRSDGYQIMQALAPLFAMGWSMYITKGDSEPLRIDLVNDKGKTTRSGEGTTLSVALRRMTIGMSKEFTHMME